MLTVVWVQYCYINVVVTSIHNQLRYNTILINRLRLFII